MPSLHHLPAELSSFVGRGDEVTAIGKAISVGRVLTLAGPGGCGKTRLAIRACQDPADPAWSEVCWVGLERESAAEGVVHRVADALDIPLPSSGDPLPVLVAAVRDRRLLVVIDNCEHVLDGAATVVAALLADCPGIAVLATSRVSLGVVGERVWRVPPMTLGDALELLLARAGEGTPHARAAARRICDRLDRLPLALELAAGWTGTLSMAQIADSLHRPLAMLDGGARTAPFRQQTLEGSIRWSHDLLDAQERVLFRQLAVFEPGFSADDVVALAGPAALKALRGLIDKSLLVADTTGAEASYRMLGVVRAYALDRLEEAAETAEVRDRHLDLQLALLKRLAPLLSDDKDSWRLRVGAAYPNVRAAIEWGLSRPDSSRGRRLAADCAWLWHLEGRGGEGIRLLRRAAECGAEERTALRADVLAALALVGDTGLPGMEAYQIAHAARELGVETGALAAARISRALTAVGQLMIGFDAAIAEAEAARDEARQAGDAFVADTSEAFIGVIHVLTDNYPEAVAHLEAALAGPLARGDRGTAALALGWLAVATARTGDLRRAGEWAARAVDTAAPLRDFHWAGSTRCVLADIRLLQGRPADAVAAIEPIDRLITEAVELPYITGWERTKALLALAYGRPAEAVEWCRREGRWQPTPNDAGLAPETRLVLAIALRQAGERDAAARTLQALAEAPLTSAMPRLRAELLDEQAMLARDEDTERALHLHHQALRIRIDHDLVLGFLTSLEALAEINLRRGADEPATVLAAAAERARRDFGAAPRSTDSGVLDPAEAMDVRTAAAYAAKARGPRRRPDAGWASLTPAEQSVVDLAVQGLNNVEIAARLFIGRGTVKTHLAHVYAKLQVANRTELARLATERRQPVNG